MNVRQYADAHSESLNTDGYLMANPQARRSLRLVDFLGCLILRFGCPDSHACEH